MSPTTTVGFLFCYATLQEGVCNQNEFNRNIELIKIGSGAMLLQVELLQRHWRRINDFHNLMRLIETRKGFCSKLLFFHLLSDLVDRETFHLNPYQPNPLPRHKGLPGQTEHLQRPI